MKLTVTKTLLFIVAVSMLMGGCAGNPVTLKSFPVKDVSLESARPISAEACGFQLLLLIPISINSRLERAYSELAEKAGRDSIANLSVEEYWRYAFVGTTYCTRLEAVAYKKTASQ